MKRAERTRNRVERGGINSAPGGPSCHDRRAERMRRARAERVGRRATGSERASRRAARAERIDHTAFFHERTERR